METELKAVVRHLVENRWPFRIHTDLQRDDRASMNVYEEVNREIPLTALHWFFDHCETITDRNIERVKAWAAASRCRTAWAFQGEYFCRAIRGAASSTHATNSENARDRRPVERAQTANRVSSYNPYLSLYWLITGKTIGGLGLYPEENRLDRGGGTEAYHDGQQLVLTEDGKKGSACSWATGGLGRSFRGLFLDSGMRRIKHLESLLTIVGGKIV